MNRTHHAFAIVESQLSNFGLTPLRAAHELGFHTILVSNDPDRYRIVSTADEVFTKYLDEIVETDTNSADAIAEALSPWHSSGRLAGLLTVTDYNIALVAEVARLFGLPGLSSQAAMTCRDKLLMRRACRDASVPVPAFEHVTSQEQALAAAESFGYPCVVKPMTESASIGVVLCRTPEEVAAAYGGISSVATNFRGQPRRSGALVEEYLVGIEVSVESVMCHGERVVLGITDKTLGPHPYFVELGEAFPSVLPQPVQDECADITCRALTAVGHDFGAAHVEVKVTAAGPQIIEVNGRMPGGEIARLILEATGIHLQREVVQLHSGKRADLSPTRHRGAAYRYLAAPSPGTLRHVDGIDLAHRVPGVVDVEIEVGPGAHIRPARDNLDLLGWVTAVGGITSEAVRRAEAAAGQLTFDIVASALKDSR